MTGVIKTFVQALHTYCTANDIPIICLRPYDFKAPINDIDLFARKEDMQKIIAWIHSIDITIYHLHLRPNGVSFYIHYQEQNDLLHTKLDFVHAIELLGSSYLTNSEIIQRSVPIEGIHYLDAIDQTILLITIYIIKHNKPLKSEYQNYVAHNLIQYGDLIQFHFTRYFGNQTGTDLFLNIKKDSFSVSHGYIKSYIYQMWKNNGLNSATQLLVYYIQKIVYFLKIKKQIVCVLGVDGAGKSYLIDHIKKSNIELGERVIYTHFLPAWPWQKNYHNSTHIQSNPHALPPRHIVMSILKLFYYLIRYWTVYLWPSRQPIIYIFDRYIYDVLIDPVRFRYQGPSWLLECLIKMVPKPIAIIHVSVSAHIAQKRKAEVTFPETIRQENVYNTVLPEFKNYLQLNGSMDPYYNAKLAIRNIMMALSGK